jgi:hypothetical protein
MPNRDRNRWKDTFRAATRQYGLPEGLLEKVAEVESSFNPEAVSPAGAIGLMQIVPRWHPGVDPTDPVQSINYAARYLSELHESFGNWELALAAYNAGQGNVRRYGGIPPFPETQNYVKRISESVSLKKNLNREINRVMEPEGGRNMLPDATRVSLPDQFEARTLMDEIQTMMNQPDATQVSPQVTSPNLLQQISSRLPGVPVGIQALFDRETPANQAIVGFFGEERRENLFEPVRALNELIEGPGGIAFGMTGPSAASQGLITLASGSKVAPQVVEATGGISKMIARTGNMKMFRRAKEIEAMGDDAIIDLAMKSWKDKNMMDFGLARAETARRGGALPAVDDALRNLGVLGDDVPRPVIADHIRRSEEAVHKIFEDGIKGNPGPTSSFVSPTSTSRPVSQSVDNLTDQEFSRRMRDIAAKVEADDIMSTLEDSSRFGDIGDKIKRALDMLGDFSGTTAPEGIKNTADHVIVSWAMGFVGLGLREARRILAERGDTISGVLKDALLDIIQREEEEDA